MLSESRSCSSHHTTHLSPTPLSQRDGPIIQRNMKPPSLDLNYGYKCQSLVNHLGRLRVDSQTTTWRIQHEEDRTNSLRQKSERATRTT